MPRIPLVLLLIVWIVPASVPYSAAAGMNEAECVKSGGKWIAKNSTCTGKLNAAKDSNNNPPEPQEGITITGCVPSASGDPLKGLNVDKGGKNSGGALCP